MSIHCWNDRNAAPFSSAVCAAVTPSPTESHFSANHKRMPAFHTANLMKAGSAWPFKTSTATSACLQAVHVSNGTSADIPHSLGEKTISSTFPRSINNAWASLSTGRSSDPSIPCTPNPRRRTCAIFFKAVRWNTPTAKQGDSESRRSFSALFNNVRSPNSSR